MTNVSKILFIDDDQDMRRLVKTTLPTNTAFFECGSVKDAIPEINSKDFDLIIVDLNLGEGGNGFEIIQHLREKEFLIVPTIIVLTMSTKESDEVRAHELLVDDYITKPFRPAIFKAIIQKHIDKRISVSGQIKKIGPLRIDERKMQVKCATDECERDILLTLIEYRLLIKFVERPGTLQTREQLLRDVWDSYVEVQSRTVDMHVSTLRRKLGEFGSSILSVRGMGYLFDPHNSTRA